jgi:hypothetical protein
MQGKRPKSRDQNVTDNPDFKTQYFCVETFIKLHYFHPNIRLQVITKIIIFAEDD